MSEKKDDLPVPDPDDPALPEHDDLKTVELEIALHQRSFWRLFRFLRVVITKSIIWAVFFFLLYLLRDFFTLIFLTFVFSFVATSIARWMQKPFPNLGWKTRVCSVFGSFILIWVLLFWLLVPQVKIGAYEIKEQITDLPTVWDEKIDPELYEKIGLYRRLVYDGEEARRIRDERATRLEELRKDDPRAKLPEMTEEEKFPRKKLFEIEEIRNYMEKTKAQLFRDAPGIIAGALTFLSTLLSLFFLSNLFSFLIVLDLKTLSNEVKKLEDTKLKGFYKETVRNIVRFGGVVGKVLEAQAVIALVNTVLTAIGLWLLGIPSVAFLSIGVFVCGFIPVAGVFISSVPICLVGLIDDGPQMCLILIAFITGIHMLEAYVLNPRIMGAALHINPVLVLIILVIGHHAIGVWGLLLGVPICYYFFTTVIKREETEIGLRASRRKKLAAQQTD